MTARETARLMIIEMLILTVVPILLFAIGIFCEKTDKRLLFCAVAAIGIYAVCGLSSVSGFIGDDTQRFDVISMVISGVPFEDLGMLEAPPAYILIMKICTSCGTDASLSAFVIGIIQTLLAAYALYTQCETPYNAAAVLTFVFLPVFFAGQSVFTAALICLSASEYIRERRFFRYTALILIAACFDMSALLMIPLYFVMIIPNVGVSASVSAILTGLAFLFPDARDAVYDFFGNATYTSVGGVIPIAVIAFVTALICLLMYGMFKNRDGDYENLVPVLFCGACLSVASVFDSRLSGISLMLIMQSAVPLACEFKEIGRKFLGIVFPDYKMTSRLVFDGVCALALVGMNIWLVFGDVYGAAAYETALKAGLGI